MIATRTVRTALVVPALLLALLPACGKRQRPAAEAAPAHRVRLSTEAVRNAQLGLAQAGPATIASRVEIQGDVRPDQTRQAKVVARVSGVVKEVKASQGAVVKAGDLLVVLESRELAELKLAYLEAGQRWSVAKQAATREAELLARQVTTREASLQKERLAAEAGQSALTALQKLKVLGLSEAELAASRREQGPALGRLSLRAPLSGTLAQIKATVGAAVTPETELAEIIDTSTVWGEVQVPTRHLGDLGVGHTVPVHNQTLGQRAVGTVTFVAPVADAVNRTVLVRLSLPNPAGRWRPGICFQAELRPRQEPAALAVPREALHDLEGRTVVFVRLSDTEYELRYVKPGAMDDRLAAITEGLKAGETVVTRNSLTLKAEYLSRPE